MRYWSAKLRIRQKNVVCCRRSIAEPKRRERPCVCWRHYARSEQFKNGKKKRESRSRVTAPVPLGPEISGILELGRAYPILGASICYRIDPRFCHSTRTRGYRAS